MPAISPILSWLPLVARNTSTQTALSAPPANNTQGLQVVCAWPVSGQYGPGSRLLYYVLVATCIFARKAEWLRSACLAAALLFPAVAALHGIVLASVHIDAAVDMDVYGSFQLCSIGILAAPVTVRLSRTYFDNPGRNTIFVWALLVLAGLLSLTTEFYRISTSTCASGQAGSSLPISTSMINLLNEPPTCGLVCNVNDPTSPLRGGSANNIYVIPAPDKFSFSTATLLAAACCLPAVLLLVAVWLQIMEISWKSKFGNEDGIGRKKPATKVIRLFRKFFAVPLFAAAVLALLVVGERNLFSTQVRYQTEPMANVGQWAPIVGIALGLLGSFYLVLAEAVEKEAEERGLVPRGTASRRASLVPRAIDDRRGSVLPPEPITDMIHSTTSDIVHALACGILTLRTRFSPGRAAFDASEFREGRATNEFPELPGEEQRNRDLSRIRTQYSHTRDSSAGDESDMRRERSRTLSSTYSFGRPSLAVESAPSTPTAAALPRRRSTLEPPVEMLGPARSSLSYPPMTPPPASVFESTEGPLIVISSSPKRTGNPRDDSPPG